MARNRKEALERLARLEAQLRYKAKEGGLVYGVYRPEGTSAAHCYNMKKVNGEWVYTSDPHDLTIAEFAATDMQWWHELAQAVTSWSHGRTAGTKPADDEAPD